MKYSIKSALLLFLALWLQQCGQTETSSTAVENDNDGQVVTVAATDYTGSSGGDNSGTTQLQAGEWLSYEVTFSKTGRYETMIKTQQAENAKVWVEDHIENPDGRTYDVTGAIAIGDTGSGKVDGSPFSAGVHKIKVHVREGSANIQEIQFSLMIPHQLTPSTMTQNTDGEEWQPVWADEFDGTQLDTSKWTYDVGDWGWGNNELQYYTRNRTENVRIADGNLIIEARKNDQGARWTSGRLTTRGKVSFLYGKIEFRAKVPREKGNWAAGWTLGDTYVDEKSWPYCGEIDILESVGYEVDNETGNGIAHATVHTPAYYFKIGNQISSTKDVENIAGEFHTYAVEWTPAEVRGFVDGEEYYLYDKTANDKEWPFNNPQNIILNLAMGGGWGGAQGMDPNVTSQEFIVDYVRVYERR